MKPKMNEAFNEKKFKQDYKIYSEIKKFEDKINDNETINVFVSSLEKKGVLKISDSDREMWYDEIDGWCHSFRYFCLLKEIVIPFYGWDMDEYETFKEIIYNLSKVERIL